MVVLAGRELMSRILRVEEDLEDDCFARNEVDETLKGI